MRFKNNNGFTITELIIVMAIFMIVMLVTSSTFKTVVTQMGQQSKSAETQIEGIVGLEVLRADLEQAGYGIPWSFQATPAGYQEVNLEGISSLDSLWPAGFLANSFNDAPPPTGAAKNPPRAIQSTDTTFNYAGGIGSKYLVIKSTLAGTSQAVKKWTSVVYTGNTKSEKNWGAPERDLLPTDKVIVLKTTYSDSIPQRQLGVGSGGSFSTTFSNYTTLTLPHTDGDIFQVYGVDPDTNLRMPFNRADFYVKRPAVMPTSCAPNTGILYKAVASQVTNAGFSLSLALLDCVADMQIVYGLDTADTGLVNSHTTTPPTSAQAIRNQLKEIRIYILAQEGKKDAGYTYPNSTINVGESFDGGATVAGRVFNLLTLIGPDYKNYRWKIYTIVVRPKN
jgi:prepilin-type N-terminal cleavage/methylation domain-containing protein